MKTDRAGNAVTIGHCSLETGTIVAAGKDGIMEESEAPDLGPPDVGEGALSPEPAEGVPSRR